MIDTPEIPRLGVTVECMDCHARTNKAAMILCWYAGKVGVFNVLLCLACGAKRFGSLTCQLLSRDDAARIAAEFARHLDAE